MRESVVHFRFGPGWPAALLFAFLVISNGIAAGAAAADDEEDGALKTPFDSKFTVALGGFFSYVNSDFSLAPDGSGSSGEIDLEDDLGLSDTSASAWLAFAWRFQPRHQLQVEWFQLNRDGDTFLTVPLIPGIGNYLNVQGPVSSEFDLNLGRVTYGYSILRDEEKEFSFLAGLHVATFKASVAGTGQLNVGGMPVGPVVSFEESSSTLTYPLPHFGGQFVYQFAPKWTAKVLLLAFALDVGDYRGTLIEGDGTVAYQVTERFGIGTGIKYFNFNLQSQQNDGDASFKYEFIGPTIFGYMTF